MSQLRLGFALVFKAVLMCLCLSTIKPASAQKYSLEKRITGFQASRGVTVNDKHVYVADYIRETVEVYNHDGTFVRILAKRGTNPNDIRGLPLNVLVHPNGTVLIANHLGDVHVYSPDGTKLGDLYGAQNTSEAYGMAVDSVGDIFVNSWSINYVQRYSSAGMFLSRFRPVSLRLGMTVTNDGLFVMSDPNGHAIEWYSKDGLLVRSVTNNSQTAVTLSTPAGVTVNTIGQVFVGESAEKGNKITIWEGIGVYKGSISIPGYASFITTFGPRLYVSNDLNGSVDIYLEADTPVSTVSFPGIAPNGWTRQTGTGTLESRDSWGVRTTVLGVDSQPWKVSTLSTQSFELNTEGIHTVDYYATDVNGNIEATKTATIKIDTVAPTTVSRLDQNGLILYLDSTDATSGVSKTYYSINGGPVQTYSGFATLPMNSVPVVYWSEDVAGNSEPPKTLLTGGLASSVLSKIVLEKGSTLGGRTISSTISLSTAQSTATTINLASDNPNVVVPASITIDAGQTTKTISIETKPVGGYTQTNITATLGTQTRLAQLDLLPPTAKIRISPPVVTSESTAKATITLSGNAPLGGLVVDLESDETAASVPLSITVPEGLKTATFNVTAGKVTEETYAYISATVDGVSAEASLTIRPKSIKPTTLSITESLVGGANGTGTITLSDPAPSGGLDIDLATNNSAVQLPLVVKIEEGKTSANFSFTTSAVSSTITATVSAKANGATVTDTIEVKVKPLGTLVASPSTLPGKAIGSATLTLASPTATPLTVSVSSSNPAVVMASKTLTIAKGQSQGIVKFTTALVSTDTTSTIVCSSNGLDARTDITVQAARPSSVVLFPSVVLGGKSSLGTVTISSAAPVSGLTVALRSSDSSAVVPSFVLVPSGKTTATFTITTSKVTASKNITITASANGTDKTATLGVRILTIASITFNPASIEGGGKANGLLTLTDVAPVGGMTVALSSDKAGVVVPSTLLVPAGKNSVAFVANTLVTGSAYDATITGTANGETGSGKLKVLAPVVSSFTLSSTNVKGGDKPLGTVKIAKASTVDVVVNVSSSNTSVASVPATVTIPKGQLLATFQVTTTKPSVASSVTLSATTGGLAKSVVLKVSP
jgi:hypothetical protein